MLEDGRKDIVISSTAAQTKRGGSWKWLRNPGAFSNALAHVAAKISSSSKSGAMTGSTELELGSATKKTDLEVEELNKNSKKSNKERITKCEDSEKISKKQTDKTEDPTFNKASLPAVVRDHKSPHTKSDLSDLFLQEDSSGEAGLPQMPPSLNQIDSYIDSYHERLSKFDGPHKVAEDSPAFSLSNVQAVKQTNIESQAESPITECLKYEMANGKKGLRKRSVSECTQISDIQKQCSLVDTSKDKLEAVNELSKNKKSPALNGHKKSRSAFSILGFFDRILLPHDKTKTKTESTEVSEKEANKSNQMDDEQSKNEVLSDNISQVKDDEPVNCDKATESSEKKKSLLELNLAENKEEKRDTKYRSPARNGVTLRERSISERSACKIITTSSVRNKTAEKFPNTRPVSAFIDRDFDDMGWMCDNLPLARPLSLCDLPHITASPGLENTRAALCTDPLPRRQSPLTPTHHNLLLNSTDDDRYWNEPLKTTDFKDCNVEKIDMKSEPVASKSNDLNDNDEVEFDKKEENVDVEESVSESDSCGSDQARPATTHELGETCQWETRTDESFSEPEYK